MTDIDARTAVLHGPAVRTIIDLPADLSRALDLWAAAQRSPQPDREDAILLALRDWLTGLGLVPAGSDVHEGLH